MMLPSLLRVVAFVAVLGAQAEALSVSEQADRLTALDSHYYYPQKHGLNSLELKMRSPQIDRVLRLRLPKRYVRPRGRYLWRAPGASRLWVSGVPGDLAESRKQAISFFRYRLPFLVPTPYSESLKKLIVHRTHQGKGELWRCFQDRFSSEPVKTLYIDDQGKVTRMEVQARGRHSDIRYSYWDKKTCPQGLLLRRARYTVKAGEQMSYFEHQFYYTRVSQFHLLQRISTMVLKDDGSAVTAGVNPFTLELYEHRVNLTEEELKQKTSAALSKPGTDVSKPR